MKKGIVLFIFICTFGSVGLSQINDSITLYNNKTFINYSDLKNNIDDSVQESFNLYDLDGIRIQLSDTITSVSKGLLNIIGYKNGSLSVFSETIYDTISIQHDFFDNGDIMDQYKRRFYEVDSDYYSIISFKRYYESSGRLKAYGKYINDSIMSKTIYYESGGIKSVGRLLCLEEYGYWMYFYESGVIKSSGEYSHITVSEDIANEISDRRRYIMDGLYEKIKVGLWSYFNEQGVLIREEVYSDEGKLLSEQDF